MELLRSCSIPSASLFMLLYIFSAVDILLLANMMGLNMLFSGAVSLGQLVPLLVCSKPAPSPTWDGLVSRYSSLFSSNNFMHASFIIDFALSNNFCYVTFQVHSVLTEFWLVRGVSVIALNFCGSGFMACLDITLPKNQTSVHLKWYLFLFSFRFSLPSSLSYHTTKISSMILNTLGTF